jgi:hypothetical protein
LRSSHRIRVLLSCCLGSRSALEWVIDQYQVSTHKSSGITNDPNRLDDPEYLVRLIGQVITVSLETVQIVTKIGGRLLFPQCDGRYPSVHRTDTLGKE